MAKFRIKFDENIFLDQNVINKWNDTSTTAKVNIVDDNTIDIITHIINSTFVNEILFLSVTLGFKSAVKMMEEELSTNLDDLDIPD